ncbi:hypothetical protein ACOMHN_015016 [Nucella lapillus]
MLQKGAAGTHLPQARAFLRHAPSSGIAALTRRDPTTREMLSTRAMYKKQLREESTSPSKRSSHERRTEPANPHNAGGSSNPPPSRTGLNDDSCSATPTGSSQRRLSTGEIPAGARASRSRTPSSGASSSHGGARHGSFSHDVTATSTSQPSSSVRSSSHLSQNSPGTPRKRPRKSPHPRRVAPQAVDYNNYCGDIDDGEEPTGGGQGESGETSDPPRRSLRRWVGKDLVERRRDYREF